MAEEDTPAVPALDYSQLPAFLEKLGLTPPAPPQLPSSPGQGGVAGFLGDVGKAFAGGGSGLLDLPPGESDKAGARALLDMGINMLMASGPSYVPRGLGEIIGYGLQGAQQGYQGSELAVAQRLAAQQAGQQQTFEDRLKAVKAALPILTTQLQQQRLAEQARIALGGGKPGTSISDYASGIAGIEGTGKNPNSTAFGHGQFLEGTWNEFAAANPDLFKGMSPAQVLAARGDPVIATKAINWLAQKNADDLTKNGVTPSGQSLGIAHYLGSGPAAKIMAAPDNTPVAGFVGAAAVKANPELATMTVGQLKQRYASLPAPGFLSAKPSQTAAAAPGAPAAQPGIQVGGEPPPPPGAAPGAAVAPIVSMGDAITAAGNSPALQPPLGPQATPPRKAADAMVGGMNVARASPLVRGTGQEAGPSSAVATVATPPAPWAATPGAGATSYSDSPTITAPAAASPPAAAAATPTATTAPAASTGEPAPFTYQRQPLPADLQARVTNPLPPEQLSLLDRQVQSAVAGGNPAEIQTAQNNRATAIATARAEAVKEGEAWQQNERNKQQEIWQKKWDAWNAAQNATTAFNRDLAKDEATRRGTSQQKVLDDLDTETKGAHDALEQLGVVRSLSQAAGQPGILNSVPQAREWLVRIGAATPEEAAKWSAQDALDAASNRLMTVLRNGTGFQRTTNMDLGFLERAGPGGSWTPQQFREARLAFLTTSFQHQQQYAHAVHTLVASGMSLGDAQDAADKKVGPAIPQLPGNLVGDDQLRWGFDTVGRGAFYKDARGNLKIFSPPDNVRRPE